MAVHEPIDPRVRLAIAQWPADAPRGAVSTFCAEHGISRKSFYELRKRAQTEGPAAVLEPRMRRPKTSPAKLSDEVKQQAIGVRAALESSGLDHGPISVHKMRAMGLDVVPSIASLARVFRQAGAARLEPKKRPRAAWRRFVYPVPNACWQLDATEYVLTGGRKCVIFQLIDDHSRYAVGSHVAWGETSAAAIVVFDKAVAAHGVPQRLLSDNGGRAQSLTPRHPGSTRGPRDGPGCRADHRQALQAQHPGQERALPPDPVSLPRQTATRCDPGRVAGPGRRLRPPLQHRTPTPGLPGRVTPQQAWDATPAAEAPRPTHEQIRRPMLQRPQPAPLPEDLPADTVLKTLTSAGVFMLNKVFYNVGSRHGFAQVLVIADGNQPDDKITVTDLHGEILIEHTRPAPGITYVGNGRPRGPHAKTAQTSPKS